MHVQDLQAAKTILSLQKIDYDSDGDDTINWDGSSVAALKIGLLFFPSIYSLLAYHLYK